MTGKRLIVRDGDYAWIDTTTGYVVEVEDAFDLINQLHEENEQLRKDSTVLILANQDYRKENEQLKKSIKRQQSSNNECAKLIKEQQKEIEQLKRQLNDKEVEWLRNNTVWEQMPSSKRIFTKTSKK